MDIPEAFMQTDMPDGEVVHVRLVGEIQDVEPYFLGADSFLLTSRVDPFPCVIHEAMAAGLPTLVFDQSGGAVEAVSDGAGLVVKFADYVETCGVINRLYDKPLFARKIAARASQRVRQNYRFGDYADNLIGLCESEFGVTLRTPQPKPEFQPRLAAA